MNLSLTDRTSVNFNETLGMYLNDIDGYKPISREEELELIEKSRLGFEAESKMKLVEKDSKEYEILRKTAELGLNARNKVIESNQKFVYAVAKRYRQDDLVLDLISEGNLGMLEAFKTYKPEMGTRFISHASFYINRNIHNYLYGMSDTINKPLSSVPYRIINEQENRFFAENGRFPQKDELRDLIEATGKYVSKNDTLSDLTFLPISKQRTDDNGDDVDDSEPVEYLEISSSTNDYDDIEEREHNMAIINSLMDKLTDQEKQVIKLSFGLENGGEELTNKEIGILIGVSTERARQIKKAALEKMSNAANA